MRTILWRRLDRPGMETGSLEAFGTNWSLQGSVLVAEGQVPCRLEYAVVCDSAWNTLWARVSGWIGESQVSYRVVRNGAGQWRLNNVPQPAVEGCCDVDLAFTPMTNLLPIRRLQLAPGQSAPVRAAWLRFPEFRLEPLEQSYRCVAPGRYRYESDGGRFAADLDVDDQGLVLRYGDLWKVELEGRKPT